MTKQEKIQESYGEYWQTVKDHIDENGWDIRLKYSVNYKTQDYIVKGHGVYITRPISLFGIEHNNGWIKIESEDDLPKESGWYDFQVYPQRAYKPNYTYWHKGATKIGWFVETYTHYQPIIKRQAPIY